MTNCKVIVNAVRKGLRPYPDRLYAVDGTDCDQCIVRSRQSDYPNAVIRLLQRFLNSYGNRSGRMQNRILEDDLIVYADGLSANRQLLDKPHVNRSNRASTWHRQSVWVHGFSILKL